MAQSNSSLKDLAKPLRPLIESLVDEMEGYLNSHGLGAERFSSTDPHDLQLLDEEMGFVLSEASFGKATYLPPLQGDLASPFSLRMSISDFAASECSVLYICRALTEFELTIGILAQVMGADIARVAKGCLSDTEWDRFAAAVRKLFTSDYKIIHKQHLSVSQVGEWLKQTTAEAKKRPFVILDDALLLSGDRQAKVDELSRMAAKYDAVIAVVLNIPAH